MLWLFLFSFCEYFYLKLVNNKHYIRSIPYSSITLALLWGKKKISKIFANKQLFCVLFVPHPHFGKRKKTSTAQHNLIMLFFLSPSATVKKKVLLVHVFIGLTTNMHWYYYFKQEHKSWCIEINCLWCFCVVCSWKNWFVYFLL